MLKKQLGKWRRIISAHVFPSCVLALAFSIGSVAQAAGDARAEAGMKSAEPVAAQLTHDGQIRYQMKVGGWVQGRAGVSNALLPLKVDTRDAKCRLDLSDGVVLRAGERSVFALRAIDNQHYELDLTRGDVYFALAPGQEITVNVLELGAVGRIVPVVQGDQADGRPVVGHVRYQPEGGFAFSSVSGVGTMSNRGGTRSVRVAEGFRFRSAGVPGQFMTREVSAPAAQGLAAAGLPNASETDVVTLSSDDQAVTVAGRDDADDLADYLETISTDHPDGSGLNFLTPPPSYSVEDLPAVGQRLSPWTPPLRSRTSMVPPSGPGSSSSDAEAVRTR